MSLGVVGRAIACRCGLRRRLRERRGLSLEELAERAGLSFRGLVYIEHGRRSAGFLTIFKIADGLELPVTALFDYPPPPAESPGV